MEVHAEASGAGVGGAAANYPLDDPLEDDDNENDDDEDEDDDEDDDGEDEELDLLLEEQEKKDDPDFDEMIAERVQAGNIKMKVCNGPSG